MGKGGGRKTYKASAVRANSEGGGERGIGCLRPAKGQDSRKRAGEKMPEGGMRGEPADSRTGERCRNADSRVPRRGRCGAQRTVGAKKERPQKKLLGCAIRHQGRPPKGEKPGTEKPYAIRHRGSHRTVIMSVPRKVFSGRESYSAPAVAS